MAVTAEAASETTDLAVSTFSDSTESCLTLSVYGGGAVDGGVEVSREASGEEKVRASGVSVDCQIS